MNEQPPAIPYVDNHDAPRRVLWVTLEPPATQRIPPVVSIDGRQYIVYWGTVGFEVPADRPVHVSVHVEAEYMTQAASALLLPEHTPELVYDTHFMAGVGSLRGPAPR
jgi:hypothetical protein